MHCRHRVAAEAVSLTDGDAPRTFHPTQDGGPLNQIYDGGLQAGWLSSSYGCVECVFNDAARARSGSTQSVYAQLMPWAALVLESLPTFSGDRCGK